MTTQEISTLNSLIATTLDSADGYRQAAELTDNADHRALFAQYADERTRAARDLQQEVRSLGGEPEDDGTVLAMAHRTFLKLRDAVSTRDDAAIVAEVERGEDHIKAKFEKALDDGLDSNVERVVRGCYSSVRSGHDRMSALKHQMQDRAGETVSAGRTPVN